MVLKFDWIQIEVTSYCNAMCAYCPHTVYRDIWASRHLDLDTFERLVPYFSKANLVFLQGWGEPFLHPHFFTLVKRAKQAGCLVGTTTNGTLMEAEMAKEIVTSGMDILAFSLAGVGEEHGKWRQGSTFWQVLEAIDEVVTAKRYYRTLKPDIHVAYMLLRSGLESLPKLPMWLQGRGIKQVVINTLDFLPSPELEEEVIYLEPAKEQARVKRLLEEVVREGRKKGLEIYYYLIDPDRAPGLCTENVLHSLFIGSDGSVSPCVFTNLPVSGTPLRYTRSGALPVAKLTFGNVREAPLDSIWRSPAYREFRSSFLKRVDPACQGCLKPYAKVI